MPKNLPLSYVEEKNKVSSGTPFLVLLDIEVIDPVTAASIINIRVAKNDEDVSFEGNTFFASSFEFEYREEPGAQPDVSISIVDYNQTIQSYMQTYNGCIGSHVKIYAVNAGDLTAPAEDVEFFDVIGASASDYNIRWTLGAENTVTLKFPRRMQSRDKCPWQYKGAQCGYVGGLTSCDLSFAGANGCVVHNNSLNYGGYVGLSKSKIRYV